MTTKGAEQCFVVMPFGVKPVPNGGGRTYDFDKVYRVIMERAIRQAGLEPIRADHRKGGNLIHTDMFKDLRDRPVVLADLSLDNPNVFYELGIRHVMSPTGTVLMCCAGSNLPFDVKLSRVIFYRYDGESLDWEEAERVVQELHAALTEARRGTPDSPVHALLEHVLAQRSAGEGWPVGPAGVTSDRLDLYQKVVAQTWIEHGADREDLERTHARSAFGVRALAYWWLLQNPAPLDGPTLARTLYALEQYDLSIEIFARLEAAGELTVSEARTYGSAISEHNQSVAGAERGLQYLNRALALAQEAVSEDSPEPRQLFEVVKCYAAISGMHLWLWELTKHEHQLAQALEVMSKTLHEAERLLAVGGWFAVGRLAQLHLRQLLLLRVRDQNRDRPDVERHRDAILGIRPTEQHNRRHVSWLRWYQAITLADAGDGAGSLRTAFQVYSEDAKLMNEPHGGDIGRRQYTNLRRLIEHNSQVLRNPTLIGHISQLLHVGHRDGGLPSAPK